MKRSYYAWIGVGFLFFAFLCLMQRVAISQQHPMNHSHATWDNIFPLYTDQDSYWIEDGSTDTIKAHMDSLTGDFHSSGTIYGATSVVTPNVFATDVFVKLSVWASGSIYASDGVWVPWNGKIGFDDATRSLYFTTDGTDFTLVNPLAITGNGLLVDTPNLTSGDAVTASAPTGIAGNLYSGVANNVEVFYVDDLGNAYFAANIDAKTATFTASVDIDHNLNVNNDVQVDNNLNVDDELYTGGGFMSGGCTITAVGEIDCVDYIHADAEIIAGGEIEASATIAMDDGNYIWWGKDESFGYDAVSGAFLVTDNVDVTGDVEADTFTATNTIHEFSTDGTMADNSDLAVPTEAAVVTYVGAATAPLATTYLRLDATNDPVTGALVLDSTLDATGTITSSTGDLVTTAGDALIAGLIDVEGAINASDSANIDATGTTSGFVLNQGHGAATAAMFITNSEAALDWTATGYGTAINDSVFHINHAPAVQPAMQTHSMHIESTLHKQGASSLVWIESNGDGSNAALPLLVEVNDTGNPAIKAETDHTDNTTAYTIQANNKAGSNGGNFFAYNNGGGRGFYAYIDKNTNAKEAFYGDINAGTGDLYGGDHGGASGDLIDLYDNGAPTFRVTHTGDVYASGTITADAFTATNTIHEFSTDGTMADNSDLAVPTEAAVVTYVAAATAAIVVPTWQQVTEAGATTTVPLKCESTTNNPLLRLKHSVASQSTPTLFIESGGTGTNPNNIALKIVSSGGGDGIYSYTDHISSTPGYFWANNASTNAHTLIGTQNGGGAGVEGENTGTAGGYGVIASIQDSGNNGDALWVPATGTGKAIRVSQYNGGGSYPDTFLVFPDGDVYASGTIRSDHANSFAATSSGYMNWGATLGTGGYGVRDNAGNMEYKHSGGAWTQFASGGAGTYVEVNGDTMTGPLIVDYNTATASVHIENASGGNALYIDATGNTAATATLLVETNNTSLNSKAIEIVSSGGAAGYGLHVETSLLNFRPIRGYITNTVGNQNAVEGLTLGDGDGIHGEASGAASSGTAVKGYVSGNATGIAGWFQTTSGGNTQPTIYAITNGAGHGVWSDRSTNGVLYYGDHKGTTGNLIDLKDNGGNAFSVGNTGVVWATGYSASGVPGIDDTQTICCTWEDDFTCSATATIVFDEGLLVTNNCP